MFLLKQPSAEVIARFISAQRQLPFSYPDVGATQREIPYGYTIDHNRVQLGHGKEVFDRAVEALSRWKHFDLDWARIVPEETPIEIDAVVAVLTKHFGFWSLNACRVVYLIDEKGPVKKFGFAYGTLPGHVERGEERFTIEWHEQDDSVWYDILAFSRPNQLTVKLGYPITRLLQKRFARASKAAMIHVTAQGLLLTQSHANVPTDIARKRHSL